MCTKTLWRFLQRSRIPHETVLIRELPLERWPDVWRDQAAVRTTVHSRAQSSPGQVRIGRRVRRRSCSRAPVGWVDKRAGVMIVTYFFFIFYLIALKGYVLHYLFLLSSTTAVSVVFTRNLPSGISLSFRFKSIFVFFFWYYFEIQWKEIFQQRLK